MKKINPFVCSVHKQIMAVHTVEKFAKACKLTEHTMTYTGWEFSSAARYVIVAEGPEENIKLFEQALEAM